MKNKIKYLAIGLFLGVKIVGIIALILLTSCTLSYGQKPNQMQPSDSATFEIGDNLNKNQQPMKQAIIETTGLTLFVFISVWYVIYSIKLVGIQKSISYTFEAIRKKYIGQNKEKKFLIFIYGISITMLPFAIYNDLTAMLWCLLSIALTGSFPYVANKKILPIHMFFIFLGIAGVLLELGFNGYLEWIPSLIALGAIVLSLLSRYKVFLIEVVLLCYTAVSMFNTIIF